MGEDSDVDLDDLQRQNQNNGQQCRRPFCELSVVLVPLYLRGEDGMLLVADAVLRLGSLLRASRRLMAMIVIVSLALAVLFAVC